MLQTLQGDEVKEGLKKLEKKMEKHGKKEEAKQGRRQELKRPRGTEDSTLKRTVGDAAQEKFRITYEARHILKNYLEVRVKNQLACSGKGPL